MCVCFNHGDFVADSYLLSFALYFGFPVVIMTVEVPKVAVVPQPSMTTMRPVNDIAMSPSPSTMPTMASASTPSKTTTIPTRDPTLTPVVTATTVSRTYYPSHFLPFLFF